MRALSILALIAVGASCHLDKLLNSGGGGARPLSHNTPVGLLFTSVPRAPRAGPLGPVRVSVVDSTGQPVAGVDGVLTVTIGLATNPAGATLRGTPTAQPARGVATFSDLRLDRATSGYSFTATAGGLPSVTSDTFTVMPAPPTRLTFTSPPSDVSQGGVVTPPVVVTAFDSLGNKATDFTGAVTLQLLQNDNIVQGVLSGATVHAVLGTATFDSLRVGNAAAGSYTLAAFAGAAPVAKSAPFKVSPPGPPPPPPGTLTISTVTSGTDLPSGYTVTVDGNTAGTIGTSASITVTGVPPGDHRVALSDVPASCAVAGANPLTVNVPAGGTGHGDFAISCGQPPPPPPPPPGPHLLFTDQPAIAQAGQPNSRTVRVTLYDAQGNKDVNTLTDVTLSIGFNAGGGTLTRGGTIVMQPGLGGTVQWEQISIDKPGFGYTLHATAPGFRDAFSDPFDVTAGPPPPPNGANGLGFVTQPGTTRAGDIMAAVTVTAMAPGGVRGTGYNGPIWISLVQNATGATLTGTRRAVAVNGLVTYSDLRIDKPGRYILRATAWPLNYMESNPFDVTP